MRKPILKKTFALRRIGYKVIPYEDETDSRYSFTTENIVFVNKANPTYKAEAARGDEFLMRHVISIVAEAVAQEKHPEGKDALEVVLDRLAKTLQLMSISGLVTLVIGIPIGIYAALHRDSLRDRAIMAVGVAAFSIPSFVIGILSAAAAGDATSVTRASARRRIVFMTVFFPSREGVRRFGIGERTDLSTSPALRRRAAPP